MFLEIYQRLVESRKEKVSEYRRYSGLHRHHIIPKHAGGTDDPENFTYLNLREHIISHFLLWKIYKQPNDLRAMYMLGGNLTPERRKKIGEFCRDNKIGFHKFTVEEQRVNGRISGIRNRDNKVGIHAFTPEQRKLNSSHAGKCSQEKRRQAGLPGYILTPEQRLAGCSAGGKKSGPITGNMPFYTNGVDTIRSNTPPGGDWVPGITMKESTKKLKQEYKEKEKLHLIDTTTDKSFMFYATESMSVEQMLQLNPHIRVYSTRPRLSRDGVFFSVSHENINKFSAEGWKLVIGTTKVKGKKTSTNNTIKMFKYGDECRVPILKYDEFIAEGWSIVDMRNQDQRIKFKNYTMTIPTEYLEHFVSVGWEPVRYTFRQSRPTGKGAKLRSKISNIHIKVQYEDINDFLSMGFEIVAKHPKEVGRIRKELALRGIILSVAI